MFDIISIGSATFDVLLKSSKFPIDRTMIGEKIEADQLVFSSGGGGTNTAVGFSRLGLKTACVARFGEDLFGQFIREDLKKEKLDQKYLIQRKEETTDYSTILVNSNGSRIILVSRGKTRIDESIFPWQAIEETRYLYIASLEGNIDLLTRIVEKAREKDIDIVLNPGSREIKEKEKLKMILPKLKILILNKEEADIFGLNREVLKTGLEVFVITNGRQGAKLYSKEKCLFAESFTRPIIDETGAGDAFSSGFVAGIVKGFSLEKSLKLGMAEGASVVGAMGAKTGLLNEEEVNDWISQRLRIEQIS